MATINRNSPPTDNEIKIFTDQVVFNLPLGFIDFFKKSNGADIITDKSILVLWPLTEMIQLNKAYNVEEFAPQFFIFSSDGADMAFAVEKSTGYIYEMPFIGMSKEEAVFRDITFTGFISNL